MPREPTPFDPTAAPPMQHAKRAPDSGASLKPQRHVLRPIEEYVEFEEEGQLRIPKNEWPAGFALKWVTFAVWGQPFPQVRARSEKGGWVPVHQEDFDGMYRGRFMPAEHNGEIVVDGLVLMARPQTWSDKADGLNRRRAEQRVAIKEMQLRMGDLGGVTLASDHPSAVRSNIIERSVDTIAVPLK